MSELSPDRKYQTLCPEHGWGVQVDEDGCCGGCGNGAYGAGVDEVAAEIAALRARADRLEGAAKAYRDLCTCYRIGSRPSEALHRRIEAARRALEAEDA